jgi:LeuA-like protein with dimerisation domain
MNDSLPPAPDSDVRGWSVRRIDIRSPIHPNAWPVARVELDHPERGRVTDIGSAPGAFDAAFCAVSQIIGVKPRLLSFNVRSISPSEESLSIMVEVMVDVDGECHAGKSVGVDLVRCAVEAWLNAVARTTSEVEFPSYARKCRRFQVTGIDCNDDLWMFASSDEGAAEAIAAKFRDEEISDVVILR